MAKGEAKKTNTAIDQARGQIQGFQTGFNNTMQSRGDTAYGQDQGLKNTMTGGYTNFATTGGISPEDAARFRALYGSGSGGGYTPPAYTYGGNIGGVESGYKTLAGGGGVNRYALPTLQSLSNERGGISDENYDSIRSGIGGFTELGKSGGYSPELQTQLRGQIAGLGQLKDLDPASVAAFRRGIAGYDEYANTGGLSPQARTDIMARGTSVIPSFYNAMNNQARLNATASGNYNPMALNASMRNSARDQSRAAQDAARDTRIGLQELIDTNRQFGIKGLATDAIAGAKTMNDAAYRAQEGEIVQGRNLTNDIANNRIAGLTGQTNAAQALADSISQTRLGAANAMNDLTRTDLEAVLGGLKGWEGVIGNKAGEAASLASAASSASNADRNFALGIEKYLMDTKNANMFGGLEGLGNVYTSRPGETGMYYDAQLQNQGMTGDQVQSNLGLRAQNNPNVSAWDRIMQGIGTVGGAAGAVMGGLGGFGGGGTRNTGGFTGGSVMQPNLGNWYGPAGASYNPQGQWTGNPFTGWQ